MTCAYVGTKKKAKQEKGLKISWRIVTRTTRGRYRVQVQGLEMATCYRSTSPRLVCRRLAAVLAKAACVYSCWCARTSEETRLRRQIFARSYKLSVYECLTNIIIPFVAWQCMQLLFQPCLLYVPILHTFIYMTYIHTYSYTNTAVLLMGAFYVLFHIFLGHPSINVYAAWISFIVDHS